MRVTAIPMPSIIANRTPPITADVVAALTPPRAARTPPVMKPDAIAFQGSSFFRIYASPQSKVENNPPHAAKLPANTVRSRKCGEKTIPPSTGDRALIAAKLPNNLSPRGELRNPLNPLKMPPPMAPMAKAPPISSRMRSGHGSRSMAAMRLRINFAERWRWSRKQRRARGRAEHNHVLFLSRLLSERHVSRTRPQAVEIRISSCLIQKCSAFNCSRCHRCKSTRALCACAEK